MSLSNPPILDQMLSLIAGVFDAHSAVLFLPNPQKREAPETSQLSAFFSAGDCIIPNVRIAPGQGLVGWILQNRQPIMLPSFDDQHNSLEYYKDGEALSITSFMGVPLTTGGALCVDTMRPYAFSDKEHSVLQLFGTVLDGINGRLSARDAEGAIPRYFMQLGLLESLRTQFRHWSQYISNFLQILCETTGFDYCSFSSLISQDSYCIESENQPLLIKGSEPILQMVDAGGLTGWVFRNGQPIVHSGEECRAPSLFGDIESLPPFPAVVCLPVLINGETKGVVSLANSISHKVDESMRTFLLQAMNHLSLHLENMYLRSRLRSQLTKSVVYRDESLRHEERVNPIYQPATKKNL